MSVDEQLLRIVVDQLDEVLWIADPATMEVLFVNQSAERAVGHAPSVWRGSSEIWDRLLPAAEREETLALFRRYASRPEGGRVTHRVLLEDGSERWFSTRVTPVHGDGGAPRLLGAMLDITEAREAEVATLESERRFRELSDAAFEAIAIHEAGTIWFVNRAFCELFELGGRGEAVGCSLFDFIHPDDRARAESRVGRPPGPPYELRVVRRGGEVRHAEVLERETRLHGRAARVQVFRDVTEAVELERMKHELVRTVAHELKTPMTVIKGHAQRLLRNAGEDGDASAALRAIVRAIDRMNQLGQDMLDVWQVQLGTLAFSMEPLRLDRLLRAVAAQAAGGAPRHEVRLGSIAEVTVDGDAERLGYVLRTLIANAIRYSPGGGDVDVSLDREAGFAKVSVSDRGVGIPRSRQARIFESLYRAHIDTPHDYGGIGIGLYLSREIVARHGGSIGFTSEEGRGSTFFFSLPVHGAR